MEKLSPKVQALYSWLLQGNIIEQCTTAGRCIGMISTHGTVPPSSLKAALNTLLQNGLLHETEVFYYGIRWSRFTVKKPHEREVANG